MSNLDLAWGILIEVTHSAPKHISFGSGMLDTSLLSLLREVRGQDSAQVLERPVGPQECLLTILQMEPLLQYRFGWTFSNQDGNLRVQSGMLKPYIRGHKLVPYLHDSRDPLRQICFAADLFGLKRRPSFHLPPSSLLNPN